MSCGSIMPKILSEVKKVVNVFDYEYISNDPAENADNFDPKWASFRDLRTDEERYHAIRKRWENADIPDPQVNLTFRNTEKKSSKRKYGSSHSKTDMSSTQKFSSKISQKKKVSRRRSRSCTRPYEQLILNLEKNYRLEYSQLMFKHNAELQEMLQLQYLQMNSLTIINNIKTGQAWNYNLHNKQKEVLHLLTHQYNEVQNFLGAKNENMDVCRRYLEEVKAFFTFYQRINDDEVTLQMTDEQYEYHVETEKMYSLYSKFYH